jgi:P27 family predicted phage terminase small subunit
VTQAPAWLSDDARTIWRNLRVGIVEQADPDQLAAYCSAVADYQKAQQQLDRTGPLIRGADGAAVRNPLLAVKRDNAEAARRLARQLGITGDVVERDSRKHWRNQRATERTITALRDGGRIEPVDDAALALARHLARALDRVDAARFPAQTANLARVHLTVLRTLRGIDDSDRDEPAIGDLLAALSAPLGDEPES